MQHRKSYEISLFIIACILINYIGKWAAAGLHLPVWLDSFGTVCAAYALGPFCGAVVGATVNLTYGFIHSTTCIYALTNIVLGILVGYFAKKGYMRDLFKTMSLSFLVTLIAVAVSAPLNYFFANGMTGNIWGDGIIGLLKQMGLNKVLRCIIGEFYVDFLDKVVTMLSLYGILKLLSLRERNEGSRGRAFRRLPWIGRFFLLLLMLTLPGCISRSCRAQEHMDYNSYVETIYNDSNGLPGGKANDIAQTKDGILWIGTYGGLYRYNGSSFQWMNHYDAVKNVNCLYTDEAGRLWIGTNDSGLSISINEEISNVLDSGDGLPADSVRCITECADGNYYVGTSGSLAVVSLSGGLSVTKIIPQITYAKSITADEKGNVAAITEEGNFYFIRDGKIILQKKNKPMKAAYSTCRFDENGILYVGMTDGTIQKYQVSGRRLKRTETVKCGHLENIKSLKRSENGETFICADNGVGYIDSTGKFRGINTNKFNSSIDHMLIDYQGNLWFTSSRQGLLRLCKSSFAEIFSEVGLEENVVNAVIKWNKKLYFGMDSGLAVVDEKIKGTQKDSLVDRLKDIRIRNFMVDGRNHLWICTSGEGVWEIAENGVEKIYTEKEGLLGDKFRMALELKDGTIALAGDSGISFLRNGRVQQVLGAQNGLENPKVLCLLEQEDGSLWAGTDGNGIAVIKDHRVAGQLQKKDGLSSEVVMRMLQDPDNGGIFIVTSNSLCFQKDNKITVLKNFPYYNNLDIIPGNKGELFVLSSAGIYVVDRKKLAEGKKLDYVLLNATKGLRESLTPNAWNYIDENHNLYLCGGSGVVYMNLNDYNNHNFSYRMFMKSIKLDGVTDYVERGEVFHIPRGVSKVEIIPELLNYSINDPYVRVWLEGFEDEPTVVPQSELKNIVYTNLPTGEYVFHMAVFDNQRTKVIEESTYQIVKDKEIYDHWWFYLYYGIVLIMTVAYLTWLIVRTQIQKKLNLQKKELELARNQIQMGNETIITIARTVDAKDENTSQHSQRVSEYSVMIARKLGYTEEELEILRKTALLHDIGKIAIPDRILNKAGRLTDEEYGVMKSHVIRGAEILKNFTFIEHVDEGALYHHERYDGRGYVHGLKGEDIPLNARIIGIADAFDAMTANRVYRKKLDLDFVLEELRKGRGTQFDPRLVDILLELLDTGVIDVKQLYEETSSAGLSV